MPKTKVTPKMEDVPLWDALVDELGDPRPYTETKFSESYREPGEPWIDPEYFDELLYEVAVQAEESMEAVDGWREAALEELDQIHVVPPQLIEWYNSTEITTQFAAVGALSTES